MRDVTGRGGLVASKHSVAPTLSIIVKSRPCPTAVLLFRTTGDFNKYKNLFDEATFYDKQVC